MNVTKVLLIALISSASTLLTLWMAGGMTIGGWFIPLLILIVLTVISDKLGLGSISKFFERR